METFGCCHLYVECSDALKCLKAENPLYEGCQYRSNLESGKIFYGKNKGLNKKPEEIVSKTNSKTKSTEIYLHCFERLFCVGFRMKNGLTYNLTPDQFETILTVFEAYKVPYKTECGNGECIIDSPDQKDPTPANSRVYFKIDDFEFHIYNANGYMMKNWRAEKIAKSLLAKGFEAKAETVGKYSNVSRVEIEEKIEPIQEPEIKPPETKKEIKEKVKFKQTTLFDFERVS